MIPNEDRRNHAKNHAKGHDAVHATHSLTGRLGWIDDVRHRELPGPPEWMDSVMNHHDGRNHWPNYPIGHHVMDVVDNEGGR